MKALYLLTAIVLLVPQEYMEITDPLREDLLGWSSAIMLELCGVYMLIVILVGLVWG